MRKLLSVSLGIFPPYNEPLELANKLLHSQIHKAEFIDQLILYDQLWIPTSNLLIVPILRQWLGDPYFDYLIKNESIVLFRHDNWFGYVGNGNGLNFFKFTRGPNRDLKINIGMAGFLSLDESLNYILSTIKPTPSKNRIKELESILLDKIIETDISTLGDLVRHETYTDILNSPILLPYFGLRHDIGTSLDSLKGVGPKALQIYNPHRKAEDKDSAEINTLLEIAYRNLILAIASELGLTDIEADNDTFNIYRAKGQRFGFNQDRLNSFLAILDIEDVPSAGSAVIRNLIGIKEILEIRESNKTEFFRNWLQDKVIENKEDAVKQYVKSIKSPSWVNKTPYKVIRLAIQGIGGVAGALLGDPIITSTLISAADSFLLERWATKGSPALFINNLRNVLLDKKGN